jgi:hypothetical protein
MYHSWTHPSIVLLYLSSPNPHNLNYEMYQRFLCRVRIWGIFSNLLNKAMLLLSDCFAALLWTTNRKGERIQGF